MRDERDNEELERDTTGDLLLYFFCGTGKDASDAADDEDDDLESGWVVGEGAFLGAMTTSLVLTGVLMLDDREAELDSRERVFGSVGLSILASASCIFFIIDKSNGIPLRDPRGLLLSTLKPCNTTGAGAGGLG